MPVIIPREQYRAWLSPDTPAEERSALLASFGADQMAADPVSSRVNSPRNDDPSVLEPAEPLKYRFKRKPAKDAAGAALEATEWLFRTLS